MRKIAMRQTMETGDFYVLVEGPAWGGAQFYSEWLRAAAAQRPRRIFRIPSHLHRR
jgi:hypothetical protein